ncbi:MAG: zinc-binding dehydrogenase [Paracoccaceae bacterium]
MKGDAMRAMRRHELGGDLSAEEVPRPVSGVGEALISVAALRAAKLGARFLPLGFASGEVPQIPANILLVKNLTVHGFYWSACRKLAPELIAQSIARLFRWGEGGRLCPHISHRLPLERAAEALQLLRDRAATDKVVLEITPRQAARRFSSPRPSAKAFRVDVAAFCDAKEPVHVDQLIRPSFPRLHLG